MFYCCLELREAKKITNQYREMILRLLHTIYRNLSVRRVDFFNDGSQSLKNLIQIIFLVKFTANTVINKTFNNVQIKNLKKSVLNVCL